MDSTSSTAALPTEVEAQLNRVPDVIGEEPIQPGPGQVVQAGDGEASLSADDVREMMESVSFEAEDVRDLLGEFFDFLAEHFQSDHWKLTERQGRMLGKPATKLLNAIWAKLCEKLPDVIAGWCESTPGLAAMLLACGIVVVPKVRKQYALSRGPKPAIPEPAKKPAARVTAAEPEIAGGIPVATVSAGAR